MRISFASIVSCFLSQTIGTKVLNAERFLEILDAAIKAYDPSKDRVPGQHFIMLPAEACECVSAGVGKRTSDPADYIARFYRGNVDLYLRREKAAKAENVAAVVYTKAAYLADPDVAGDPAESARVQDCDYVLVTVLAFAGPKAPLSPVRFVHNLAGGNNEALVWSADEIRKNAADIKAYWDAWCVVAD